METICSFFKTCIYISLISCKFQSDDLFSSLFKPCSDQWDHSSSLNLYFLLMMDQKMVELMPLLMDKIIKQMISSWKLPGNFCLQHVSQLIAEDLKLSHFFNPNYQNPNSLFFQFLLLQYYWNIHRQYV